jgi:hypothetical protein
MRVLNGLAWTPRTSTRGTVSVLAMLSAVQLTIPSSAWSAGPEEVSPKQRAGASSVQRAPVNTESGVLAASRVSGACAPSQAAPTTPFAFTMDGKTIDDTSSGSSTADSQRCTDLALVRADVQIRYDALNSERRLNVVAGPDAALKGESVSFRTYSNYTLHIERGEIRLFAKDKTSRQTPLVVIPVDRGSAVWRVPAEIREQLVRLSIKDTPTKVSPIVSPHVNAEQDGVVYVLRVYDASGRFDETTPKSLDIAHVRGGEGARGASIDPDLMSVYGGNALGVHNIPINGGAVLVSGRRVPPGHRVTVMGVPVPVDAKGDFATRQIVAPGEHQIEVALIDKKGVASVFSRSALVPDHDFFYVALADLTAGKGTSSGPIAVLNPDHADQYKNQVFVNGRLAFYLKGKVQGDTLITASMDTRDQPIQTMFHNFDSKDPRYLLRNLDPNKYYPIYGDDSTLVDDAPTRGKFYVRIERGDNNIVWGNFKTTITGTELVRYERGLYGARAQAKTSESTRFGERRGQVEAFVAEPGTLGARDAFRGTGGSLYFMSRQNLTQGSERLTVESRDSNTGLVLKTRSLSPTQDYDIDYLQGRVILKTALSSTGASDFIVQAGSLSGVEQYLVATYEYAPNLQANRDKAYGGRASIWATDHVQVGVTGYNQTTPGEKLAIGGADATIRLSPGSYVKVEGARSNGPGSGERVSLDGGFTFASITTSGAPAWARHVEVAADLSEIIKGADGRLSAYWKQKDRGYAGPGELTFGQGGREMGVKSIVQLNDRVGSKTKLDGREDQFRTYTSGEQNLSYSFNDYWKGTIGARLDNNKVAQQTASPILNQYGQRTDVAVRADYNSHKDWGLYGFAQATAARTGDRDANNRVGIGGDMRINATTKGTAEVSVGNGGLGGKVGVEHKVDERRTSYLNYAMDPDRTDIISRGGTGAFTSGTRERFSDSFSVFGEERLKHGGGFSGVTHAFGLDFVPVEHWKTGLVFETGRLSDPLQGDVKRTSVSPSIGYSHKGLVYSGRFEYRHDDTATARSPVAGTVVQETVRDTYLMNNSLMQKVNVDWRYIGKLNGSYSTSTAQDFYRGNYLEGIAGMAYRPVSNDRLNALFKYTYFYNTPSPGQVAVLAGVNDYSQQSHVMSADATYDVNGFVTVGAKYAVRTGSIKDNTQTGGDWFDSKAQLLIGRIDLHVVKEWDLAAELRTLDVTAAKDRQTGALLGVYRHMGDNFKFGVGYNFTKFSDDLTNLSNRNQGVFVNAIGKF